LAYPLCKISNLYSMAIRTGNAWRASMEIPMTHN
jgi:hypothetical protein